MKNEIRFALERFIALHWKLYTENLTVSDLKIGEWFI